MKLRFSRHIDILRRVLLFAVGLYCCLPGGSGRVYAQYYEPSLTPPPVMPVTSYQGEPSDTILSESRRDVRTTVPRNFEELMQWEPVQDFSQPQNITTEADYDPLTQTYTIHIRLGKNDLVTPFVLTRKQYDEWQTRQTLARYWKRRNAELALDPKTKEPFNILDMNFSLGPLEKIFGPGGVSLKTTGSVLLSMGIKSNKTDNPALSLDSRRKTFFDFDQKIQASIQASVGNRLNFNMSYNTDATFSFDS
ncbi:MAG: hypothetical protein K2L33_02985, partial [Muribaculaceae bacterium]|nr:hypothetical protein [Muribaculaceae bacterium]